MQNRDEVIRNAACVAANHGTGVARALAAYLETSGESEREALRGELVALSTGFERGSGNGSTFEARQAGAVAALEAWDGPKLEQATYDPMQIRAARVIWASVWGSVTYTDGTVGHLPYGFEALLALGVQTTGSRGDAAVLWALAEQQRRREAEGIAKSGVMLAQALDHVATELGSETARNLVERMPERLREYVRKVWQRGQRD